jgi:hypothetical protein
MAFDYQRGVLHRRPSVEVRTEAKTGVLAHTAPCHERRQVSELAVFRSSEFVSSLIHS